MAGKGKTREEPPEAGPGTPEESERHFRDLVDLLPQPVFEVDQKGVFTFANRCAVDTFGYTAEDVREGKSCLEVVAPADRERAETNIGNVLRGQSQTGNEYLLLRRDGSTFPAVVNSSPIVSEGRVVGLRGIVVDLTSIRHAEERLFLLETVIQEAPDGIQIVDLEGFIIFSNRAVEDIYGFSPEEFRGRHVNDLNRDPSFAGEVILPAISKTGRWEGELEVRHKDGHTFPVWLNTSLVMTAEGKAAAMVGIIKDLTERKKAEMALRQSEELYRTVVENTGTGIATVEEDMTLSFVNAEFSKITGVSREELIGRPIPFHMICEEDRARVGEYHARRREDPASVQDSYEFDLITGDGKRKNLYIIVSMIPGTKKSLVSMMDMTEKVRSERDLRESEEKFRDLAENSPNIIFINQAGRVVYVNRLCEQELGYSREELLRPDFDFRTLIAPDSRELVERKFEDHMRGENISPYEYGLLTRGGERKDVINSPQLIAFQGKPAILGIVTDISARKKAEEELCRAYGELERQNQELRKLDRMKDALIRDVSHELKTPVAKHAMQLEILKPIVREHELSNEEHRALAVMEESIRRQESVISNLLDLSRLEGGTREYRREPVRVDDLLRRVLSDYSYATEIHGIDVGIEAETVTISSDAEMLWHLFSNLVNNAIKFQRGGAAGKITVSVARGGGEARVEVRDNGIGMAREEIPKAFSRFYQVSTSSEGSGVGLAICHMIAEGLGGAIRLESGGSGKGTAAIVTLPLTGRPA
jgi:PAS domain S-box-containing protein